MKLDEYGTHRLLCQPMRNDNLKSITFYVTPEELQQYRELAEEYEVSLSAVIRSLLKLPRIEPFKQKSTKRSKSAKEPE